MKNANRKLSRSFDALVAEMPPQAIMDDVHYENSVEMIDRLMAAGKLTKGQELYRVGEALRAIDPIWDVLFPEKQRRIAHLLVEDITVSTSGIDIRFRTNGIEQIVEEIQPIEDRHA